VVKPIIPIHSGPGYSREGPVHIIFWQQDPATSNLYHRRHNNGRHPRVPLPDVGQGAGPPLLSIMQDRALTRTIALVDLAITRAGG